MDTTEIIQKITPVLRHNGISKAGLFGSYTSNSESSDSDVDILVSLSEKANLLDFVRIKLELEEAIGKEVDLVEYTSIKPRLRDQILAEEIRIYGG